MSTYADVTEFLKKHYKQGVEVEASRLVNAISTALGEWNPSPDTTLTEEAEERFKMLKELLK